MLISIVTVAIIGRCVGVSVIGFDLILRNDEYMVYSVAYSPSVSLICCILDSFRQPNNKLYCRVWHDVIPPLQQVVTVGCGLMLFSLL